MSRSTPGTHWGTFLVALFAGIFVAFQNGKMPATIPTLRADLELSLFAAGWAVSLLNAVACVLALPAGALADLLGARRIIIAGLLITGLASAGGALATGGTGLLISRFVEGLGATTVFVAAPMMILRAVDPRGQRFAFGIWSGYMPAGTSAMILISPLAIVLVGWRGLWWLNAALLAGFALVFWAAARRVSDPRADAEGRVAKFKGDLRAVLGARGAWLLALCFATYTASFLCIASFLPTLLIETADFAPVWAATVTALVVACNVPGNAAGGWLLQRGANRGLLIGIASATMGSLSLVLYASAIDAGWKIAFAMAYSFIGGLLPASILGGAPVHAPSLAQVGTTNGLIIQLGNLGQLVAPPVFAALATVAGWSAAPWLTFALGAAGGAFAVAIARHERRRVATS
ncbi:MAG TPA: MFS transporter [Alphaproteobacteria bacterium]|jgi:MFS family permease